MSGHWLVVPGVVRPGHKVASGTAAAAGDKGGTIAKQISFFKERGLDLSGYHPATLNVSIHPKILILARPRYTFRWVTWLPDHSEDFSFSPCTLTFDGREYEAFVYYPHPETKRAHWHPPSLVEVLAPLIDDIRYGATVSLRLNTEEVALLDSPGRDLTSG